MADASCGILVLERLSLKQLVLKLDRWRLSKAHDKLAGA